jgi:thiamine-phosphate pyrophosphorylase
MSFSLPKVYPLTDTRLSGLSHAEQVKRLAAGGASLIQLREKHVPPTEFYPEAQKALDIARRENVKLIINDRVDIALALKADGVHLGQDDLPPESTRKLLGDKAIIGYSTHNLEQALAALRLPVDYIAIGPVFPTSSKETQDPALGLERLRQIRQALGNFPLVAIGGITMENFRDVLRAGADSVAVMSFVLSDSNLITEYTKLFLT